MTFRRYFLPNRERKEKLERLYIGYRDTMYHSALGILKSNHDAEDAVHLAFQRVAENLDKINEEDCNKTGGYLVIIVKNVSIDMLRRRKREVLYPDSCLLPAPERFAQRDALVGAIKRLPEQYRAVLLLKYSHGYDNGEIAAILGIREDNVRQRISRGKKLLAEILREEEIEV